MTHIYTDNLGLKEPNQNEKLKMKRLSCDMCPPLLMTRPGLAGGKQGIVLLGEGK